MKNKKTNTEDKVFEAAHHIFLLYGYHGTRLQQIALLADVHKSAIHYYFRSKEKLYARVVKQVLEDVFNNMPVTNDDQKKNDRNCWFLFTELYNNQQLFEIALRKTYPSDWQSKLKKIKDLLEIKKM